MGMGRGEEAVVGDGGVASSPAAASSITSSSSPNIIFSSRANGMGGPTRVYISVPWQIEKKDNTFSFVLSPFLFLFHVWGCFFLVLVLAELDVNYTLLLQVDRSGAMLFIFLTHGKLARKPLFSFGAVLVSLFFWGVMRAHTRTPVLIPPR
jgi:hypothetical protein